MNGQTNRRPLIAAALLLGVGIGGFIDGILFHQLLQWHNMLSARLPPRDSIVNMEVNMFWDGLFHAFTWTMTALGLVLLWRAVLRPDVPSCTRTFVGSLALGWGLFNVVEGVIDHHVLHVHHVTETAGHLIWDLGFIAFGLALMAGGGKLIAAALLRADEAGRQGSDPHS